MNLGFITVNLDQALGLFWAKRTTIGDGTQANRLCAARKRLAIQLIAAIANVKLLGTTPGTCAGIPGTLIEDAQAAAASCDVNEINRLQGLLDAFNNSGDSAGFPAGLRACRVGPENKAYIDAHGQVDPTTKANCQDCNVP